MDTDTETTQGQDAGSVSGGGGLVPSAELLESLQSLGENQDYTLLPQSLHQIAEAYSLQEQYHLAVQFLELEKLYHERLLSNLSALQESWESQWKERRGAEEESPHEAKSQMDTLCHICRSHLSPSSSSSSNIEQKTLASIFKDIQNKTDVLKSCQDEVDRLKSQLMEAKGRAQFPRSEPEAELFEEGQEVEEETTPEEEELRVEWPTGVPQASEKDLAKLSTKAGNSSPDGLVSILKRRRASLDGLPPPTAAKENAQRKVRFTEPDDHTEHDEVVGGDSCLILLLLCLVTVVISLGGTALYCTLVDTYSNICVDFQQNVDFYFSYVRRFF
uniref:Consortin C-terminal domain-containing protein n=1 Tax=Knipowitschia caucasica TaxID=637954 RepID=A0AAV2KBA5_KNICA